MKQKCPCCRQFSGVDIVYGSIDRLSEVLRSALRNGSVVLGGAGARWDWEEELIDTKCLQCQHEWHGWHKLHEQSALAQTRFAGERQEQALREGFGSSDTAGTDGIIHVRDTSDYKR